MENSPHKLSNREWMLTTANGYELGKEAGAEDAREGRNHDSKCPPNDSLSFCTGYKAGYEVGWIAQRTLSE
jgi:hypothetical protein